MSTAAWAKQGRSAPPAPTVHCARVSQNRLTIHIDEAIEVVPGERDGRLRRTDEVVLIVSIVEG
jgi:hypothetical protein